ncbi:dihydrofolate reductase [Candidatus Mycoplasma mahonii]|uniref:dihydrofolate reductase n=1 Tax=Candidatus Mycoplasma mahonii TaxID=3004105 RepID=UPI0026F2FE23|nr:dihydrofolate reductase [Candidatus Mycoplasma mahonii]WKX02361.1 dihydrofolate reductase [Candidatus Mycoplasma mahonii]
MIKLIVAVGFNNLIGNGNKMPWHIVEEFKHFKKMTMGHDLLFGKTTFLGLPKKLPGRKHIVLGSAETKGADESITSLNELQSVFKKYKNSDKTLFIAGGKSIYEQFYQFADEIYVSEMKTNVQGDVFLNMDLSDYKKTQFDKQEKFTVYKYTK